MNIWIDRPYAASLDVGDHHVIGPDDADLPFAQAVVVGGRRWDGDLMDRAPELRVIARTGIGTDAVDLAAATERGIAVTNTPDGPTVSTAEHALTLLLAAAKTIPRHQQRLRQATGDYVTLSTAIELDGTTLGLVGYGRIARRLAIACRALGMRVLACDPFLDPASVADEPVDLCSLDDLCEQADVISLHAPLTPETAGLFDAARFASCRHGVVFVNCARGGLVDHDALVEALHTGQVSNAGLDVTDPEPLPADHPLLQRDDVIVTPHVASSTVVGRQRMLDMAIDQVLQVLDGRRPTHLVNLDLPAD